jgi:HSP20 family molecular chaperone IbpA
MSTFSHPLINPVTHSYFPRSLMMDDFNDMLSWREHQAQQQRLTQQYKQLTHTTPNQCNSACANHCLSLQQQPLQRITKSHHDNCNVECAAKCHGAIGHSSSTLPTINLEWSGTEQSAKEYIVSVLLPTGMKPSDVSISLDELDSILTITCQQKIWHQQEKNKHGKMISCHSSVTTTQRSFQIPEDVDLGNVTASKIQGEQINHAGACLQLIVHLPKLVSTSHASQTNVKQIAIQ